MANKFTCPPQPASGAGTFSNNLVGLQLVAGGGLTQGNFEFTQSASEKVNRTFNTGTFSQPINLEGLGLESVAQSRAIIEKNFKVKSEKRFRGIAGLSMGGFGSLILSLKHPDLFAAAAPLSAAVWSDNDIINLDKGMYNTLFAKSMGENLVGKDRLTDTYLENSPFNYIQKKTKEELSKVRYWIDCGDDDFLTAGNALLHIELVKKNVPHEFRMRDGAHNWTYWRTGIIDALSFIGDSFHQK
jgi:S-formylglutathione hydrolase FrmB